MSYLIVLVLMASQWADERDVWRTRNLLESMQMHLAMQHIRAAENEEAIRLLDSVVARNPDFGGAHHWLGRLALEREDWTAARNHLEIAIELSQRCCPAPWEGGEVEAKEWVLLAKARDELGDRPGAVEALDIAVDFEPSSIHLQMERARTALEEDDLWTALKHFRAASSRKWYGEKRSETFRDMLPPAKPGDAFAGMASVAQRMNAHELARCAANAAIDLAPENASFHAMLADIAELEGDIEQGIASAMRAVDLGEESGHLYVTLGRLHHRAEDWSRSIAAFDRAFTLEPETAESLPPFPLDSLTRADSSTLRTMLTTHAADHPDSRNTLYALGAIYLRDDELERSRELFDRLRVLDPESSDVEYNLALIHARRGDEAAGSHAMKRYLQLKAREDEDRELETARALRWAEFRTLRQQAEYREAAVTLGLELIQSGPADINDRVELSAALAELGRRYQARILIAAVLEESPYHYDAHALAAVLAGSPTSKQLELLNSYRR